MLKGDVFTEQVFPSDTFALFIDTFLDGKCGIRKGFKNSMSLSYTSNSITINSGIACIKGRFLREDSSTTLSISSASLIYCRLVIEIDLSKSNTPESLNQLSYKILKSSGSYPALTQTDIVNTQTGVYQYELANFACSSSGIQNFNDARTYLDFDSIYAEIDKHIKAIDEGSIFVTKEEFNNLVTVPIGAVQQFAGAVAPTKYLLCNGQAVSRTTYKTLFDVIGTIYGAGDGSTTFNVPDFQNRVPVGVSSTKALGHQDGYETHTLSIDEMPKHTHIQEQHRHSIALKEGAAQNGSTGGAGNNKYAGTPGYTDYTTPINKETGGGKAHNNMQPYTTINYIIRAM